MSRSSRAPVVAAAISVSTLVVAIGGLRRMAPDLAASNPSGASFPLALSAVTLALAAVLAAWVLALLALTRMGGAGRRVATALTPRLLRGALLAGVCGVVAVGPAHADTPPLDGLRLPDRTPAVASPPADGQAPPVARSDAPEVVVRVGDSLWRIAERRSPGAKVAQVATDVDRLHAANRDVIGDDPDVLRPGQRLQLPQEGR